ncbi:MAG: nuclear transport factor 2 family protein [Flavobacterium sp.]|nr:MAG: nuclear transport factor 2 family protein [Flavobacterium sp.]
MKRFLPMLILAAAACSAPMVTNRSAKDQVLKAEKDFNDLAAAKGLAEAFYTFADDNAIIKREHDTLIVGRDNIRNYYSNPKYKDTNVSWKPDFVDVSSDGTLAYTYGKYVWTSKGPDGKPVEFGGVFHTVWKKQKDGSMKYVFD